VTDPTPRQREVLVVIHRFQKATGYPITLREIGDRLGISSTNAVADHLRLLEAKGLVSREQYRARTLKLTTAGRRWTNGD
jgi:repressor LexA